MRGPLPSPLSIRLTNGIDTKSDEYVTPGMLTLENAVFNNPGALRKRSGYARSSAPVASNLGVYRSELVALVNQAMYSRTLSPNGFTSTRGPVSYLGVTETPVSAPGPSSTATGVTMGIAGNMAVYLTNVGQTNPYRIDVVDNTTGASYLSGAAFPQNGAAAMYSYNGNVTLFVGTSTTGVDSCVFNSASPPTTLPIVGTSPTGGQLISIAAAADTFGPSAVASYGAATSVYVSNSGLPPQDNSSSLIITTGAWTGSNFVVNVAMATDPSTGNRWGIAVTSTGQYYVFAWSSASTATQVLAPTLIETVSSSNPETMAVAVAAGVVHCFYSVQASGDTSQCQTRYRALSTSGSFLAAAKTLASHCYVASNGFPYNSNGAVWVNYTDLANPTTLGVSASTMYLMSVDASQNVNVQARALYESSYGGRGNQCNVSIGSDGTISVLGSQQTQVNVAGNVGYTACRVDVTPTASVASQQFGNSLYVNGGMLFAYDGTRLVEQNFLHGPRIATTSTPTTGGQLSNGTYSLLAVYAWQNRAGELEYSRPSAPVTVTITGGTTTQRILANVRVPMFTRKFIDSTSASDATNPQLWLFRTTVGGSIYYLETQQPITQFYGGYGVFAAIFGITTDVNVQAQQTVYTNGGTTRDDPLPHSNFLVRAGDRLWGHPGQGRLWYSKKRVVGHTVEFSALLTYQLSSFQNPVGMVELQGKNYLVFSPTQTAVFSDNGLDSSGNAIFSDDALLLRTVGLDDPRSIINIPGGCMFKAKRGWWFVGDGQNDQYIGAPVEAYNSYSVASSIVLTQKNQVKIYLQGAGAPVLVYDTLVQQWSVEINANAPSIVDAAIYANLPEALDSGGFVWEQQNALFTDNGTAVIMHGRTGWIAPSGNQGFNRIQAILFLGAKKSDHNLIVNLRYDYKEAVQETITIPAGSSVPATDDYEWRILPKIQKCRAISIEFQDDFTGYTPGEGLSLNEIAIITEPKSGAGRLAPQRTVQG